MNPLALALFDDLVNQGLVERIGDTTIQTDDNGEKHELELRDNADDSNTVDVYADGQKVHQLHHDDSDFAGELEKTIKKFLNI